MHIAAQFVLGFCFELKHEIAVHVGVQYFRMHVSFCGRWWGVAELGFDSGAKIALRLSCAVEAFELIERHCREERARPGAEVLCRNSLAGDFLEIGVHVGRHDVRAISGFVDVLEQFLTGQFLARFYDLGDAPGPYARRPLLAALAGKAKTHLVSVDGDMAVLKGFQAVAVVLLCVGLRRG